jgi:hypothetical protein
MNGYGELPGPLARASRPGLDEGPVLPPTELRMQWFYPKESNGAWIACCIQMFAPRIVERIMASHPAAADLTSWRY